MHKIENKEMSVNISENPSKPWGILLTLLIFF